MRSFTHCLCGPDCKQVHNKSIMKLEVTVLIDSTTRVPTLYLETFNYTSGLSMGINSKPWQCPLLLSVVKEGGGGGG